MFIIEIVHTHKLNLFFLDGDSNNSSVTQDIKSNGVPLQPTKVEVKTEPGLPVSSSSQPMVSLGSMHNDNTVLSTMTSVFDPLTPPSSQPTNNNSLRVPDKQAAHTVIPTSNMHNPLVNDGNFKLNNFIFKYYLF